MRLLIGRGLEEFVSDVLAQAAMPAFFIQLGGCNVGGRVEVRLAEGLSRWFSLGVLLARHSKHHSGRH